MALGQKSALRADETQHTRGLVLTPRTSPTLKADLRSLPVDPLPSHPIINYGYCILSITPISSEWRANQKWISKIQQMLSQQLDPQYYYCR